MQGHRLVRKPRKLNVKGGTANVVGCTCGAIGMAPTVAQRIAWHAEHVRTAVSPVVALQRDVGDLLRRVEAVTSGGY